MERDPARHGHNVVLTGFMGTGKTVTGRVLASRLGYEFVDTDEVIEARHGPITEIFREHGEGEFRRLERRLAGELAGRSGLVISTGGRMMVDPVNAEALGATGDVVCLVAPVDTIVDRVTADAPQTERPMLAGPDVRGRIAALLTERAEAYARFRQVETGGRTPAEVADEIVGLLTTE